MVTKVITLFFAAGTAGVVVVGAGALVGLLQPTKINITTNTLDNRLNKCAP